MQSLVPLLLLGAMVPCALAQSMQVRFTAGATVYADDGAVTETSLGGGARFYLSRRWSVEPEYLHTWRSSGFTKSHSNILWGNVAFDFRGRDQRIVPYWFAAPGRVAHTNRFGQFSFTTVEAGFGTGVGVRALLTDRLFLSPQVRFGLADAVFAEATISLGYILKK